MQKGIIGEKTTADFEVNVQPGGFLLVKQTVPQPGQLVLHVKDIPMLVRILQAAGEGAIKSATMPTVEVTSSGAHTTVPGLSKRP